MIEGLINMVTPKQGTQVAEHGSGESVESVALAGAAAIQRLIADRDNLRNCASSQLEDLVALSAINKDLRRRIALIRHHYVELGTTILAQLEQFDQATREAMQNKQGVASAPTEDANLVEIARRLRPSNPPSSPASGKSKQ
jgi:hypothetical protein